MGKKCAITKRPRLNSANNARRWCIPCLFLYCASAWATVAQEPKAYNPKTTQATASATHHLHTTLCIGGSRKQLHCHHPNTLRPTQRHQKEQRSIRNWCRVPQRSPLTIPPKVCRIAR